jgi:DNA replication ATP-dependent helicase Dna2
MIKIETKPNLPVPALAQLFYRELQKIAEQPTLSPLEKTEGYYQLLVLILIEVTRQERLRFTNLFSRMAYAGQKFRLERSLQYYLHTFRKLAQEARRDGKLADDQAFLPEFGRNVILETIRGLFKIDPKPGIPALLPGVWPHAFRPTAVKAYLPQVRVLAVDDRPLEKCLVVKEENRPEEVTLVRYDLPERNELFNPTIEALRNVFGFPIMLNLLDVEVDQEGIYRPRAIVVEPDYLVDVTAVAECFREFGAVPEGHLLKKFLPFSSSSALLIGNIANFFLDELMHNPDTSFKTLFPKVFHLNPLALCLIPDDELRKVMQAAQKHFINLLQVIQIDFKAQDIQPDKCYLEPTFYSSQHGLQGRLDVFFRDGNQSAIVELKSGKLFRPNSYGINASHYIQTLLYDLIIRATFGKTADPANYMLYSALDDHRLRFAPVVRAQQWEALQVRNQLLAIEYRLIELGIKGENQPSLADQGQQLAGLLHPDRFPKAANFFARDLQLFQNMFQQLSRLEKAYFTAFTGFIAREHKLAKTGVEEVDRLNGQASLWLNHFAGKQDSFDIISHLKIVDNQARGEEPLIRFAKTESTNPLANFRAGDIAVLYPFAGPDESPLGNQLFKCTIIEISNQEVVVRLRSRQFNDQLFLEWPYWNLEHDLLDTSFVGLYRGLFDFANSPLEKRELLLGLTPPMVAEATPPLPQIAELTTEQQAIFESIIHSQDYFLLWGPPGTGKTSVMLKNLVGHWIDHTQENLLLLAYTNRAVDEICEAIESYHPSIRGHYLRIGSQYSTAVAYQDQLLSKLTDKITNRKELRDLIDSRRIVVATVASIAGKPELFELKTFHRVVIDEASQILEPALVGLLPKFKHFLLIGDHKQLPAVVAQDSELSTIEDPALKSIGLLDLRNSFFERLYKRCHTEGWDWAFAQLSHQGRMHRDIMEFPNRHFYEGNLKILPPTTQGHLQQINGLSFLTQHAKGEWEALLCNRRMLFVPTPVDQAGAAQKINRHEAVLVGDLVDAIHRLYVAHDRKMHRRSIGVITPYRAQIAQIRQVLQARGYDDDLITIDTVERYQGGARDIIIISLSTNSLSQLQSLISLSDEGVDRKLNVALTRAREQLILLGNPELLEGNAIYRELIGYCKAGSVE